LRQHIAKLEELLEESKSKESALSAQLAEDKRLARAQERTVKDELAHLREKIAIEQRIEQGNTSESVNQAHARRKQEIEKERESERKEREQKPKELERERNSRADNISETVGDLSERATTPRAQAQLTRLSDDADEGAVDIEQLRRIAEQATGKKDESLRALGETLRAQLSAFQEINQTISSVKESVQSQATLAAETAALKAEVGVMKQHISNLRSQR
jgi:hypothetical protein